MNAPVKMREVELPGGLVIGGGSDLPFCEGWSGRRPLVSLEIPFFRKGFPPPDLAGLYRMIEEDRVEGTLSAFRESGADILTAGIDSGSDLKILRGLRESLPFMVVRFYGSTKGAVEVLPEAAKSLSGLPSLLASAEEDNYRTIAACAQESGHYIVAETPIDFNLARQLNIMVMETGFPLERLLMDPLTAALGYGLEYTCSVMERIRLAALSGDELLSNPFINFIGEEVWKAKEVKSPPLPSLEGAGMGMLFEAGTAFPLLLAGAEIVVVRAPETVKILKRGIDALMEDG